MRPLMEELKERLTKSMREALQATSHGMVTKKIRNDGTVQVTGGKRLKSSGAYPKQFGVKVAQLFKKGTVSWQCFKST